LTIEGLIDVENLRNACLSRFPRHNALISRQIYSAPDLPVGIALSLPTFLPMHSKILVAASAQLEVSQLPYSFRVRAWVTPSLADVFAAALLMWLLASAFTGGPTGPLHDADTGFSIRVGQWIADHASVPQIDTFSFTRPGQPWFAWEWLTDLGSYFTYAIAGFKGVLLLACSTIALTAGLLMRSMAARGANALVIVALLHLVVGASSFHYLARPHVITLFLFALAIHRPAAWWMIPMTALWANLHGGFAAFVASLFIVAMGRFLERNLDEARRTALIATACGLVSLLNPYGWHEHAHIIEFMRARWVVRFVEEFQPPRFGTAVGVYFAIVMILSLAAAVRLVLRRRYAEPMLIAAWAFLGLNSIRHIPILAICAAPAIGELLSNLWSSIPARRRTLWATLDSIARDHSPGFLRMGLAFPIVICLLWFAPLPWPSDFPASQFPVDLENRRAGMLTDARLFTTDYWADYLLFRNYPRQRVFVDGRCDFYGEQLSAEYMRALNAQPGWQLVLDRAGVNTVLIPAEAPLHAALEASDGWQRVDQTSQAELFTRRQ
jgi:hypothetical protein